MKTSTSSRDLAFTAPIPRRDSPRPPRRSAAWASIPGFLQGRRGLFILAATLAATGFLAGWTWLGTAAVLPLLYILPCVAMMAMCMKGHGGSTRNGQAKPDGAANSDTNLSH